MEKYLVIHNNLHEIWTHWIEVEEGESTDSILEQAVHNLDSDTILLSHQEAVRLAGTILDGEDFRSEEEEVSESTS